MLGKSLNPQPSIQVRTLFYFCLKSMNTITATEYFEDYSKKYEEYEEYLTEAKEVKDNVL